MYNGYYHETYFIRQIEGYFVYFRLIYSVSGDEDGSEIAKQALEGIEAVGP